MKESLSNEIGTLLEQREMTYRFLARVYGSEITPPVLAQLHDELAGQETLEGGYELLGRYLGSVPGQDWDKAAAALATEYAGLFLLGFGTSVSPFESVYVSPKTLIMQESRDQVLALYQKEGLESANGLNVPEDHVAIEFEFMSYLAGQARQALKDNNRRLAEDYVRTAEDFLSQHLIKWIPRLCQDLERIVNSDFYKGIVKITEELLDTEKEASGELLSILIQDGTKSPESR